MTPHALNIVVHVAAGALALGLGAVPLLSAKGGALHRAFGRLFVGAGTLALGCAAAGVIFFSQPGPLVMATFAASYQFIAGLRALPRFKSAPGVFDALLAAAALAFCAVLLLAMGRGNASWPPALGYTILGFLAATACYDLSRYAWLQTWRRAVRPLDHGLKMTAAYFAFASAGLGNLAPAWKPWSQIGPSMLSALVMALFLVSHIRRARAGASRGRGEAPDTGSARPA